MRRGGTCSLGGWLQVGSATLGTAVRCTHRVNSASRQSQLQGLLWISIPWKYLYRNEAIYQLLVTFMVLGNSSSPPSVVSELSSSLSHSKDSKPTKASSLNWDNFTVKLDREKWGILSTRSLYHVHFFIPYRSHVSLRSILLSMCWSCIDFINFTLVWR